MDIFCCLIGMSFVTGMLAGSHVSAEHLLSATVVLLFAVVILLWRMLKLHYGLADKLGYRPARTERLDVLFKKLHPPNPSSTSKLTAAQRKEIQEEFDELAENDRSSPQSAKRPESTFVDLTRAS